MDKIVEKFNLLDYINPVIAGAVLIAGIKYLDIHCIWALFGETVWFDNIVIQTIILLIGFYLVGIVIQTVSDILCSFLGYTDAMTRSCLKDPANYPGAGRHHLGFLKAFQVVDVIGNRLKREAYRNSADRFLKRNGKQDEFTDEECQFFFAHCTYYIQIRGLDGKPERMRDLRGFHKVLFTAFLLLTLASAIDCIYSGMSQSHYICFFASLLLSLIFLALYKRNEEYRFRMIMALYFEAESKELTE